MHISADGGRTWTQAELEESSPWIWTFWKASVDLPKGEDALAARAWDLAGRRSQPPLMISGTLRVISVALGIMCGCQSSEMRPCAYEAMTASLSACHMFRYGPAGLLT